MTWAASNKKPDPREEAPLWHRANSMATRRSLRSSAAAASRASTSAAANGIHNVQSLDYIKATTSRRDVSEAVAYVASTQLAHRAQSACHERKTTVPKPRMLPGQLLQPCIITRSFVKSLLLFVSNEPNKLCHVLQAVVPSAKWRTNLLDFCKAASLPLPQAAR